MERWPRGLRRTLGKRVYSKGYRGFESLFLRQFTALMALKILDNRRVRQAITLLAVAAMALVMLPIESYWCMWWSSHAEHIAGTFLLIGLFLLVFDKINLMFVMMFCSAGICLFLMRNANDQLYHSSPTDLPFIKLAHFNVNNAAGEAEDFLKSVVSTNADVVST